jgi:hypothetical protein
MLTHKLAAAPGPTCFLLYFMIVWYLLAQEHGVAVSGSGKTEQICAGDKSCLAAGGMVQAENAWDWKRSPDGTMRLVLRLSELR